MPVTSMRLQVGAGGVQRRGVTRRARAEDEDTGRGWWWCCSWRIRLQYRGGWLRCQRGWCVAPMLTAELLHRVAASGGRKPVNGHNRSHILADLRLCRHSSHLVRPRVRQVGRDRINNGEGLSHVDAVEPGPDPACSFVLDAHGNEQAQAIADSVVKRRFRRGELVVEQGRKSNALFILLNGRARVLTSAIHAGPRGHPGRAGVGRLRGRDEPDRQRTAHSATVRCRDSDRHAGAGPRATSHAACPRTRTLSYAILRGLVQTPAQRRPPDRKSLALLDVYGRVARTPAGHGRRSGRCEDHPPARCQPPGHGQGGGRLARDGQPA